MTTTGKNPDTRTAIKKVLKVATVEREGYCYRDQLIADREEPLVALSHIARAGFSSSTASLKTAGVALNAGSKPMFTLGKVGHHLTNSKHDGSLNINELDMMVCPIEFREH